MATSKQALTIKQTPQTPEIVGENETGAFHEAIERQVAKRAYAIFESSGHEHGNDGAHWLQAESEVLQLGLELRESGSWLAINASLPNVAVEDIQIYLTPHRVIVRAAKHETTGAEDGPDSQLLVRDEMFLLQDLKTEVDPETASAAFKDQKLTLMVKKHYPVNSPSTKDSSASEIA